MSWLPTSTRGRAVALAAVALVVLVAVLVAVAAGRDDGTTSADEGADPTTAASPSSPATTLATTAATTPPATAPGTPTPTPPPSSSTSPRPSSGVPPTLPGTRPARDVDQPAEFGGGVVAEVRAVRRVQGRGQGPGEVSGPAIQVDLRLRNDGRRAIDVQNAVVNLTTGRAAAPASPLDSDRRSRPFTGRVSAGARADGTYLFSVPDRPGVPISITFSYSGRSATVLFTGRV